MAKFETANRGAACGLLIIVLSIGGCGSDSGSMATPSPARNPPTVPALQARPVDTLGTLREAVVDGDCDTINELVHSAYGALRGAFCKSLLRQLAGLPLTPTVVRYGTGAVVEFEDGIGRRKALVLAMDRNSRYRIVFVATIGRAGLGPALSRRSDGVARAGIAAIAAGDCERFLEVATRTNGIGDASREQVCVVLSNLEVVPYLQSDPVARPEPEGGDKWYQFYVLRIGRRASAVRGVFTVITQRVPGAPQQWKFVTVVRS